MSSAGRAASFGPAFEFATRGGGTASSARQAAMNAEQSATGRGMALPTTARPAPSGQPHASDLGAGTGAGSGRSNSRRPAGLLRTGPTAPPPARLDQGREPAHLGTSNLGCPANCRAASLWCPALPSTGWSRPSRHLDRWCQSLGPAGCGPWAVVPTAGSFCQDGARPPERLACLQAPLPLPVASRLWMLASRHLADSNASPPALQRPAPSALTFLAPDPKPWRTSPVARFASPGVAPDEGPLAAVPLQRWAASA